MPSTGTIVNSDPLPAVGEQLRESPEPHATVVGFRLNSETPADLAARAWAGALAGPAQDSIRPLLLKPAPEPSDIGACRYILT